MVWLCVGLLGLTGYIGNGVAEENGAPAPSRSAIEVRLHGLDDPEVHANVQNHLPLYRHRERTDLSAEDIRRFHARSGPAIRRGLEPFGYYRPEYTASLEPTSDGWRAEYRVDPGPRVSVDDVTLRISGPAAELNALREWQRDYPLKAGEPLEHSVHDDALRRLDRIAREHGLFDARFEERAIRVDAEATSARITIHFETGPRYRMGETTFRGSDLSSSLLDRFRSYEPGDPFRTGNLLQLQRDLSDTGYFQRVEVTPMPAEETRTPIAVDLVDQPPTRYTAGIGYGTDTGPRISGGIERRYLNRHGHRAGINVELSTIRQELGAGYTIPLDDPRHEALSTRLSRVESETDTSELVQWKARIALARVRGRWLRTVSLSAEQEDYTIGEEEARSRLVLPGIAWRNLNRPTSSGERRRTRRLGLELRGASEGLASDASLFQIRARAGESIPLDVAERHRLVGRLDLGATAVEDIAALPASLRFFTGGDRSIRGYSYQSLGPDDDNGDVIGGQHLAVFGLDYEYSVRGNLATALFHDIGSAFGPDSPVFHRGAGIGMRWYLPVGALALDLARPLKKESSWRFHLSLRAEL
ncbi:MAG: autotransporter assembly complex protein TamA [Pseudomonadota bacterium]